jgi:hypothetical protein
MCTLTPNQEKLLCPRSQFLNGRTHIQCQPYNDLHYYFKQASRCLSPGMGDQMGPFPSGPSPLPCESSPTHTPNLPKGIAAILWGEVSTSFSERGEAEVIWQHKGQSRFYFSILVTLLAGQGNQALPKLVHQPALSSLA